MVETTQVFQLEKSPNEIRDTVLSNTIRMLTARHLLNEDKLSENIKKVFDNRNDEGVYQLQLDNPETTADSDKTFVIKLLLQKITTINKGSPIITFLTQFKSNPKIVIVKDINKKALQFIYNNFPKSEIFQESELMINLIDHVLVPKHEIVPEEEASKFLETHNAKKRNMSRILTTDPVAKYYNMKPGQLVRIIRPSEKAGFGISYRIVIKGALI